MKILMNPSVRSALGVLNLMCVFHEKSLSIISPILNTFCCWLHK